MTWYGLVFSNSTLIAAKSVAKVRRLQSVRAKLPLYHNAAQVQPCTWALIWSVINVAIVFSFALLSFTHNLCNFCPLLSFDRLCGNGQMWSQSCGQSYKIQLAWCCYHWLVSNWIDVRRKCNLQPKITLWTGPVNKAFTSHYGYLPAWQKLQLLSITS